ncbi:Diacylglycerol O-acyltransferase [Mycolicibacterium chubuense NBB4]|uniref:Diacylglycerol O-acyltransferase n=1 Tax=Mycolicibacterium chubuense (strain NBB4) TaxID=710421 RepID=I4BG73_MYCCN|nr:wax ester/triacylglycerol synthase family O-acyltransferase [Mycolicibacterium chubuense]AFM16280.1 Diacylglycerol O-acyltransferase [Mycolicibacterium chubuense NBB4]
MVPLDPLDVAMMLAESFNPLNIGAVLIMSAPADAGPGYADELYRAQLAERRRIDPQLLRYPHRGLDTAGIWVWRHAGALDVEFHCKRERLPAGSDRDALWQRIGELHSERLAPGRPMWRSYLIDGLDDGRIAFYIKIHHSVVDGVAGLQMITDALSADPHRLDMTAFHTDRAAPGPRRRPPRRTARIPHPMSAFRAVLRAAASGAALAERVATGEISTALASLAGRTTVPPLAAPYTRFNHRLGSHRVVTGGSWPRSRIAAIQSAAGVTANDVVTAVISGALRRWLHRHHELPHRSLIAVCPITVRDPARRGTEAHGNVFGLWLCPLGTDNPDPVERLSLVHRSMAEGKQKVATRGAAASLLLAATSIAPTVLLPMVPFVPILRAGYNLPISHVAGPRTEMYWNAAHIDEIYPVSAVFDGQGLNITTCSYADRITFGYVAGREVIPDMDTLVPLTEESLAELEVALRVRV